MTDNIKTKVSVNEYDVTLYDSGKMLAARNSEQWRDCTGDGLILALIQRINDLELDIEVIKPWG